MSKKSIEEYATEFRNAFDRVVSSGLFGKLRIFQGFPNGCCGYSSDLLAEYLIKNGIERDRIQRVSSESLKQRYTHVWLMIDEALFVDITADQFNGKPYWQHYEPIPSCCIVPRNTYLYESFDKLKTDYTNNVGIDSYCGSISEQLHILFNAVIQILETE